MLQFIEPLLADVMLYQARMSKKSFPWTPKGFSDRLHGAVIATVEEDISFCAGHCSGLNSTNNAVVELIPFVIAGIEGIRSIMTTTGMAMVANDSGQVVESTLKIVKV